MKSPPRPLAGFVMLSIGAALTLMGSEAPPDWLWGRQADGSRDANWSQGRAVTADDLGNVFLTGSFSSSVSVGGTNVTAHGAADLFIAKYDHSGSLLWFRHVGGGADDSASGRGIAVDAAGNVHVIGTFAGTADFGVIHLNSGDGPTDYSIFVATFDRSGDALWVQHCDNLGPPYLAWGSAIAVDGGGDVYAAGLFSGDLRIGPVTLWQRGYADSFLAKFSGEGGFLWVTHLAGDSWDECRDLFVDAGGNVHVTGFFASTAHFGSGTDGSEDGAGSSDAAELISRGAADMFIAKYESAGTLQWARSAGAPDGSDEDSPLDDGRGVCVDAAGNVYVTGLFAGPVASFDSTNLTTIGLQDNFLAKYDAQGALVWVKNDPGVGKPFGIALAGQGRICVATLNDYLNVIQYDNDGERRWAQRSERYGRVYNPSLALDGEGSSLVTGSFSEFIQFDGFTLTNSGRKDLFVAKLGTGIPPRLTVTRDENDLLLSWPIAATGFELEGTDDLAAPGWIPPAGIAGTNGPSRTVRIRAANKQTFYRLRKPAR